MATLKQYACFMFLWLAICSYTTYFIRESFFLFDTFAIGTFDLSIFDQATWLISKGEYPYSSVRGLHIIADHFSMILYMIAPLYWIWDTPKTLLVLQTLSLALGALPVYAIAKKTIGVPAIAVMFAVMYLLYPALQWTNLHEFHPETLATPLLLGAFYLIRCTHLTDKQRYSYFVALIIALLTKETVSLTIVALGIYAFVINRHIGWQTVMLGLVGCLAAAITIRHFNHGMASPYLWLYRSYGASPMALVSYPFSHPYLFLRNMNTDMNRDYLLTLIYPLAFLTLLAPEILLIAAPALLSNLLSSRDVMQTIYGQYTVLIIPFVFASGIVGFARMRQYGHRFTTPVLLIFLIICTGMAVRQSPLISPGWQLPASLNQDQIAEAQFVLNGIPANASISTQASFAAHLSHRRRVFVIPNPFVQRGTGYGVQALKQLEGEDTGMYTPTILAKAIDNSTIEYIVFCPGMHSFLALNNLPIIALKSPSYGISVLTPNILVLRRGANHAQGLLLLEQRSSVRIHTEDNLDKAFQVWKAKTSFHL